MRAWLVLAVGLIMGLTLGIVIADVFNLPHVVEKILGLAGATLGGCITMGLAAKVGWIKDELQAP
jgi:putative effector of murein hydrolase